jgi:hypothetical protein
MKFEIREEFKKNYDAYMSVFYDLCKLIKDKNVASMLAAYSVYYGKSWSDNPEEKIHAHIYELASFILTEQKINKLVIKNLATVNMNNNNQLEINLTEKGIQESIKLKSDVRNFE